MSRKHSLFASDTVLLQKQEVSQQNAQIMVMPETRISLKDEWLEAFWCDRCQETKWYHIQKQDNCTYKVSAAPSELGQQAVGTIHLQGNPCVSEFTNRYARMGGYKGS
ncbi:hypothetical protein [Scytonema sp. NUACC26]|uniref:hypothetical protein n=1 Tax=Scytonema sp. NUACC26 TaxID=3140176 RepID=UPI0038B41158